MNKASALTLVLGALLGANLVLMLNQSSTPAAAQTVDSGPGYTLAVGKMQGKGDGDALYLFNHENKTLVVLFDNGRLLEVLHIRDMTVDLEGGYSYSQHLGNNGQKPSTSDLKKAIKKIKKKGKG